MTYGKIAAETAAADACYQRELRQNHRILASNIINMKSSVEVTAPLEFNHVKHNTKGAQLKKETDANIAKENALLQEKMDSVRYGTAAVVTDSHLIKAGTLLNKNQIPLIDNHNTMKHTVPSSDAKIQRAKEIKTQNSAMAVRILRQKPTYSNKQNAASRSKQESLLQRIKAKPLVFDDAKTNDNADSYKKVVIVPPKHTNTLILNSNTMLKSSIKRLNHSAFCLGLSTTDKSSSVRSSSTGANSVKKKNDIVARNAKKPEKKEPPPIGTKAASSPRKLRLKQTSPRRRRRHSTLADIAHELGSEFEAHFRSVREEKMRHRMIMATSATMTEKVIRKALYRILSCNK